jgi:hypothetical protein
MLTIRSIRWALVLAPFLLLAAGCTNNEAGVDARGTTTSPDATKSTEEALKQGAEAAKKSTPSSYPGAARRH